MTLFDSGARASELCALNVEDVDLITGQVNIQHGKGDKHRIVWLGDSCRKALKDYLNTREDISPESPLFLNQENRRMTYSGLRVLLVRLTTLAGVPYQGGT